MKCLDVHTTDASECLATISGAGVILCPTDTQYALAADALSDEAVAKIRAIKGRNEKKPMHALVDSLEMAARYADIDDRVRKLANVLPSGKITFVCRKKLTCGTGICRDIDTFGFRIPDNEPCLALISAFGGPLTATSANVSGAQPGYSIEKIITQLGGAAALIDLAIDGGELRECAPSTVVDLTEVAPRVLREGAVSARDVRAALGTS